MVAVGRMVASVEADVEAAAAEIPATLKPVGASSSPSSPGFLFATSSHSDRAITPRNGLNRRDTRVQFMRGCFQPAQPSVVRMGRVGAEPPYKTVKCGKLYTKDDHGTDPSQAGVDS